MNNLLDQNLILKGKKVLLRVDLNVPMKNGAITETSRIKKIIPTIKLLIEKEAKIIILSHIGRPKGKVVKGMYLEPISKKLESLLNNEGIFLIIYLFIKGNCDKKNNNITNNGVWNSSYNNSNLSISLFLLLFSFAIFSKLSSSFI